ncbi:major capsid protein [Salmonella phage 41]|nr:major capsid protein [Salmonella phage 41]
MQGEIITAPARSPANDNDYAYKNRSQLDENRSQQTTILMRDIDGLWARVLQTIKTCW